MKSLSILNIAVATMVAAPLPAVAQTWSPLPVLAASLSASAKPAPRSPRLKTEPAPPLRPAEPSNIDEVPEVDIKPKAEWSANEGLRMTPTRIAYKRRF